MPSNRKFVNKADLILADLEADGGLLVEEQAERFILDSIKESVLLSMVTAHPMASPKFEIPVLSFAGQRVLVPAESGEELPVGSRSKPVTSKSTLDVKEFAAEVRLPDNVLEDNIERGTLKDTVTSELQKAIARDMEEIVINGDTASADPSLATMDGVLKQATSNIALGGGTNLSKTLLREAIRTMPDQYLRDRGRLVYLTSIDAEGDYRDSLSDRATPRSDDHLENWQPVRYSGIRVMPVPMFPENQGVGSDETSLIFTDPKNIWVGIHREVTIEVERLTRARSWAIVAGVRFDVKYAIENAVVKMTGIKVQ